MPTIHKYPLTDDKMLERPVSISMPVGAKILDVQMQHGFPTIWALVDPSPGRGTEVHRFQLFGTGWEIPKPLTEENYVGTIQDRSYVWHVFEYPSTLAHIRG